MAGLPLGMTAHVVFSAIDPVAPATTSAIMVGDVIRGSIGFKGLLMSDDISMEALSGSLASRSRRGHRGRLRYRPVIATAISPRCSEVAEASPVLAGEAARRAERRIGA